MRKSTFVCSLLAGMIGALAVLPRPALAELGSGWTEYTPVERVQTRGCGMYGSAGGVETFSLTCASASGDNRAEQRIENDYSSGSNQFEGEVRVASLGGTNVSVKQTFMPENGAFLMIAVATDGRLYSVGDNGVLATGVIGKWVKINTIHDVRAGTHEMYADGVLKVTKTGGRQVAWHDKYGSYRLGSGRGPITVEWRNVKYFRGGRSPAGGGTPMPPAADAGAPDASIDAAAADGSSTGAGGADGTGGSTGGGGSSGTGGSSGSSGTSASGGSTGAGTGGTRATPDAAPSSRGGRSGAVDTVKAGGCSFSRVNGGGALPWVLIGLFLFAVRRRSARPRL